MQAVRDYRASFRRRIVSRMGPRAMAPAAPTLKEKAATGQPGSLELCTSLFRHFKTSGRGSAFVLLHATGAGGESRIRSVQCLENRTSQN
jgi:hypothetical protein